MHDDKLVEDFLAHRVEPGGFGHREHVVVAWYLLERYSFDRALQLFESGARDLATRAGFPAKYHVTLTKALMHIIAADRTNHRGKNAADYLAAEPDVVLDPKLVLARHYTMGRLFCDAARSGWRAPDLDPLPLPRADKRRGAA